MNDTIPNAARTTRVAPGRTIARVFPRRTKATPLDDMAFVGDPPLWLESVGEVHVSCTFTWDKVEAERLARAWSFRFPSASVRVGGPAYGDPGGEFSPGMYLKPGYVITSRGCPNHCEKCMVPTREGGLRTLTIKDGWDVLDNNLLACPQDHIAAVLDMLRKQPSRPVFTGGLEAARLTVELAGELLSVKPERMFFAYDRPSEYKPLRRAVAMIRKLARWRKGTTRHHVSCYVLVGFEGDTVSDAERRVGQVIAMGVRAYPMFYRGDNYSHRPAEWHDLIGGTMSMGGRR